MKRTAVIFTLIFGISIFLTTVSPISASAADKTIELSLYWPLGKAMQWKGYTKFMDAVEKRTNGRVKFKRFCCGTMGGDLEAVEQLRAGALDIFAGGVGIWSRYHAPINMIVLPHLFRDYGHVWKFVESPYWNELVGGLEKYNIKPITNYNAGNRDVFNSKRPINTADDIKGLKLKVPRIKSWITLWNTMGAVATPMKVTEQYMALKTGVIDGAEMSMMNTKNNKMYEAAKYYTVLQICWIGPLMGMNLDRWNSLPKDLQDIIVEEAQNGAKWTFDEGEKLNQEALSWMEKNHGLIVNRNPDMASFKAKVDIAYKEYAKEPWFDGKLIEKIRAIK